MNGLGAHEPGWFSPGHLNLLVERIGRLGPDPAGLALWSLPDWRSLERLVNDLKPDDPLRHVSSALYAGLGTEQL